MSVRRRDAWPGAIPLVRLRPWMNPRFEGPGGITTRWECAFRSDSDHNVTQRTLSTNRAENGCHSRSELCAGAQYDGTGNAFATVVRAGIGAECELDRASADPL